MQNNTLSADFLMLNYTNMNFLINRSQFIASHFLEKEIKIKSPLKYFHSIARFSSEYLLIFDFDSYLHHQFRCRCSNSARLILVADTGSFNDHNRQVVNRLNLKGKQMRISIKHMAIKVSNEAEIATIPLQELKLIPGALRKEQNRRGILGIRFPASAEIQYFIDSEVIIINNILNRKV